jgi:hypothetical protein
MIRELGQQLYRVRWAALGKDAQRKLLLCLLANLSVAVAGRPALRLPRPAAGVGHLLLDGGQTTTARDAAFHNAALMHARTQDDFHPVGNLHIATVVVPAVLAEAERGKVTGEALLDALAAGYATAVGLSRQFSAITTPRGLRSTCLYAGMGAAVAVSQLRGHGPEDIGNTLGLASQSSFGTTQCWHDGSDEYQLHVANAASQALLCAELTEGGVIAGEHAMDGSSGFYPAMTGVTPRYLDITGDFEPNAAILETVLKRYPVSGICQPVVRLAERLATRLEGTSIERIVIEMNAFEMNYPGTLNAGPVFKSFSDRLMSARFCAGSVIEAGRFDFDTFLKPASSSLSRLISVTELRADVNFGPLSCRIEIVLQGGTSIYGELRDGGKELAIDWDTVNLWAGALLQEAGRASAYPALRDAVLGLPDGHIAPLLRCF